MAGRTRIEVQADWRSEEIARAIAGDLRRLIDDTGATPAAIARAARVSPDMVGMVLSARRNASLRTLARIALALGCDLSVRITPGAGIPIHDRVQGRMIEAFLTALHPRWRPLPEVAVRTPARGSIDLVLADGADLVLVACEFQSQLRRPEQALRWSNEKAAALRQTDVYAMAAASSPGVDPAVRRLLVVRSTVATRVIVHELPALFAAAYPAPPAAAVGALRRGTDWPGDALLWMHVHGRKATLMSDWPPELRLVAPRSEPERRGRPGGGSPAAPASGPRG